MMFTRLKRKELQNALLRSPAVVLLGPRQVGKTTLALDVALPDGGYLDLESPEDRNKLSNVEQYLRARLAGSLSWMKCSACPPCLSLCAD